MGKLLHCQLSRSGKAIRELRYAVKKMSVYGLIIPLLGLTEDLVSLVEMNFQGPPKCTL